MTALTNRLTVLAADIQAAHRAIQANAQRMAEQAITAGKLLIEAKASLKHGQWDAWLVDHAGISPRTARRYMQLTKSGLETATVADLGIRGASAAIARKSSRKPVDLHEDPDFVAWPEDMTFILEHTPPKVRAAFIAETRKQVAANKFVDMAERFIPTGELPEFVHRLEKIPDADRLVLALEARRKVSA